MSSDIYNQTLFLAKRYITKQNKNMMPISAEERLAVTLHFLATGGSFENLKFSTVIASTTISEIVIGTCIVLH